MQEEQWLNQQKVLLTAINAKYIHSNLAVYSLKANAGAFAEEIRIAEYTINHQRQEILQGIYRHAPEILGFSCYIWNIETVLAVAEDIKKVLPEVKILLGGPEVSYDAAPVMERCPFVDVVMVGEGERVFRAFLERYYGEADGESWKGLPGICARQNGKPCLNPPGAPMDMDELVFPYRDVNGLDNRIVYYETMRGCPFSCSYCLSSVEKSVRMKSLSLVFEEIRFFLEHRVRQVKFVDRTFNCSHEHAYGIWEFIGEHDNGVTNFHFEIGGDLLREEDFELLRKFRPGLVQFEIGVQSTNPETITRIRRKMNLGRLWENVERVRTGHNIHQHLDLIAGLPGEDYESFHRSFNDVYKARSEQLQLGFLKILKGSFMEEAKGEYGIQYSVQPPYEVLSTNWLSYDDILRLKQVEEMVEIYYNSYQFPASMVLLELCRGDAFRMYEQLAGYYERHGYFDRKHSRHARYEILWDYICESFPERRDDFRQTLTYDLYLRDYDKNPPAFVRRREEAYLTAVKAFFDREMQNPKYLQEYKGYQTKQLVHMVYVDEFTLNMDILIEEKRVEVLPPYSLLFDYRQRNPLNHSAKTIKSCLHSECRAGAR